VTTFLAPEDVQVAAAEGSYMHGFFLEGASWEVGNQTQDGYLITQRTKELHHFLPVIKCVAVEGACRRVE